MAAASVYLNPGPRGLGFMLGFWGDACETKVGKLSKVQGRSSNLIKGPGTQI